MANDVGSADNETGVSIQFPRSRRIDDANRLVYAADDDAVYIAACRFHYGDK